MRYWTTAEERLIREKYPDTPTKELVTALDRPIGSILRKAADLGIKKSDAFWAGEHSGRIRKGIRLSEKTQFKKGNKRK